MKMSNTEPSHLQIPRLNRPSAAHTSASRWQAITQRDATITNFVYGVLTTKIYCRPSCPARLARRANVEFYDTPTQAEQAGFRACKRCKPESILTAQSNPAGLVVEQTCMAIREEVARGSKPKLSDLAARVGLTVSHFHRVFKRVMGVTPGQYAAGLEGLLEGDVLCGAEVGDYIGQDVMGDTESSLLPTVSMDGWNEFDILLATEQGPPSFLEPLSIDPRIISVE